jgi:hypothetical protein
VAAAAGAVLVRRRPGGLEALLPAAAVGAYGMVAAGLPGSQVLPVCLGVVSAGLVLVRDRFTTLRGGAAAALAVLVAGVPLVWVPQRPAAGAADPRDRFRVAARVTDGVDVLDQVGGWLSAPAGEVLFTAAPSPVTATGPLGRSWRLAVLDDYDGVTWRSAARLVPAGLGVPPHHGPVPAGAVTQRITLSGLRGPYLPAADRPIRVTAPVDAVDPDTGMLVTSVRVAPGTGYDVTSQPPAAAEPAAAERAASGTARELAVPAELRAPVADFLAGVPLRPGLSPVEQASVIRLGLLRDRRNIAGAPSSATTSAVARLLRAGGTGTPVQFAAAYAVVMRARGVPARLVVGFDSPAPGTGAVAVHGRDVRIRTELKFGVAGWVRYDPVPPATTAGDPPPRVEDPPPPPVPGRTDAGDTIVDPPPPPRDSSTWWPFAVLLGVLLAAGGYLARRLPPVVRRAWRRRRPADPDARVAGAWHDVLDEYVRRGGADPAMQTPATLHDRLRAGLDGAEASSERLRRLADRALYSPRSCTEQDGELAWESATAVRRALHRAGRAGPA